MSPELEVINLKALCEQETGIALQEMSLSHNGQILTDDSKSLEGYSIKENDIIMVQKLVCKSDHHNITSSLYSNVSNSSTAGRIY